MRDIMDTYTTIVSNTPFLIPSHQNIMSYHVRCEKGLALVLPTPGCYEGPEDGGYMGPPYRSLA